MKIEKNRQIELFITSLSSIGLFAIALAAFSRRTREEIWSRDGGECKICGSTDNLHCAHIDHNKSNPNYDDSSNGRLLCKNPCHLNDHINRDGRNGITHSQNQWAINILSET